MKKIIEAVRTFDWDLYFVYVLGAAAIFGTGLFAGVAMAASTPALGF